MIPRLVIGATVGAAIGYVIHIARRPSLREEATHLGARQHYA